MKVEKGEYEMAGLMITSENFEREVLQADVPVLLDFWAEWCAPCQMLLPVIEELAGELTGVKICKVNVEEEPMIARKFRVMSIPTLLVIKDGKEVRREIGFRAKEEIIDMLR